MERPWLEIPAYVTFTFPLFASTWQPRPNGTLWTIGIEVWFSLCFPFLVLLVRRIGMLRFVVLACAIAYTTRYLAYGLHLGHQNTGTLNTLADSLAGRIDNFALGMAAATLYAKRARPIRPALAFAGAFVLFTASCILWDRDQFFHLRELAAGLGGYVLANAAFFLLLLAALGSEGGLARVLRFSPLRAAGIGCYSIYLVHAPLLWLLYRGPKSPWMVVVYAALVALTSYATYQLIEKPSMARGRRRSLSLS
jgi:peptidoglycan/LPS O-acetylase OafA/YrhL